MLDSLVELLPLVIPVLGLLIGLVVAGSIFVVQPLVNAITRLVDVHDGGLISSSEREINRLEQRLDALEGKLQQLVDTREFERQLYAHGSSATGDVES